MKRHHMRMAVSVCAGSEDDVLSSVANQTQTAYEDNQETRAISELGEASLAPRQLTRRMHTLALVGSLDRGSVRQLEAELERLCEEGVTGITLDLRRLTYIEAIGVSVVAFRRGLYERRGYDFALIRGPRTVQRAFEEAGLSELLPFQDAPGSAEATPAQEPRIASLEEVRPALAGRPELVGVEPKQPGMVGELVGVQRVAEPAPAV
jgi:anti-anti-sigma factor